MMMNEGARFRVRLETGGRVILPPEAMTEYVIETPGGKLWFNQKDSALGLRLLRGEERPPCLIYRESGADGSIRGRLEVGPFLAQVGYPLGDRDVECDAWYSPQYHMMEIRLPALPKALVGGPSRILDDFPAIED